MGKPMKILVAEDGEVSRFLIATVLQNMGHDVVLACDGAEAVDLFEREFPDMVIMDVIMPNMDGFEATAKIKALRPRPWVPVLYLSAYSGDHGLAKGLQCGGDDYLSKPINPVMLEAKVKALLRTLEFQRELDTKNQELEHYYLKEQEEKEAAKHLMDRLVNQERLHDPMLQYWVSPAEYFSGDLVAAARTRANVLHVLLADGAGHGLSAALNVLPIAQAFYAMTDKGYGIDSIAREANRKLKQLLPTDRFISATLISVNYTGKVIQAWNGGNPPLLILDAAGKVLRTICSRHLPLGIVAAQDFDASVDTFKFDAPCQIVAMSDGAAESENRTGEQFGFDRMIKTLSAAPPNKRIHRLRDALATHRAGRLPHDDVSLLAVSCVSELSTALHAVPALRVVSQSDASKWAFEMSLSEAELKHIDVVPMLLSVIKQIEGADIHGAQIYTILSELFNNALDHGVLGMNSATKSSPDGLEAYLDLRAERLANLTHASIDIAIGYIVVQGRGQLRIAFKDSGKGFNYRNALQDVAKLNTNPFGHGIALMRGLCVSLDYRGKGNEVVAIYDLQKKVSEPQEFLVLAAAA